MELQGLSKFYDGVAAVKDFSISIQEDEYVTLLGPSGCGKSTLLRIIAGLDQPDSGRILIDGDDITNIPTHRRGLGLVQQKFGLFPHMSVFDNIAFGLRFREIEPITDEAIVKREVNKMLELVGLSALGTREVGALSGGQRQRISLARTLVCGPKICLLDEPLGALDANLRERMTFELRRIRSALGVTFIHVTGNELEALAMGDRMIVMDQGETVQINHPDKIYHKPNTVRVAQLLSRYHIFQGHQKGSKFHFDDVHVQVEKGMSGVAFCAVRYDLFSIDKVGSKTDTKQQALKAKCVASEFQGAHVMYFFRTEQGNIIEAERHISLVTPGELSEGDLCDLHWPSSAALFFDTNGCLINRNNALEAA